MKMDKKKKILDVGCIVILIVSLLLLCITNGMSAGTDADFYAVNGDFQNYNVVRRLLDGQTPFKEFAAYLGCGHLYLGTLANLLFGWKGIDLSTSKMAFQFLSLLSFVLIALVIFSTVARTRKIKVSLALTCAMTFLLLLSSAIPPVLAWLPEEIHAAVTAALTAGNSARFLRGMAPALFVIAAVLIGKILKKAKVDENAWLYYPLVFGIPAGWFIFYSNDYGLASTVCGTILFLTVTMFSQKDMLRKLKEVGAYLVAGMVSFLILGMLVTGGNIQAYLSSLFGTGGMQAWYYNNGKSFYLYDIDYSLFTLLQGGVAFLYFCLFVKNLSEPEKRERYGILAFMNMAAYAAANEYKLLSGGHLHEVAYTILFLTAGAEILRLVLVPVFRKIPYRENGILSATAAVLALALCGGWSWNLLGEYREELPDRSEYVYVENVGDLSYLGKSILATDEFLTPEDRIFSTYASALETYRGQFQPSGTDYIIHALGDEAIASYMETFRAGDFDYVTTIREEYSVWEYWVQNANWYFYRELLAEYQPVYANDYQVFWKKSDKEQESPADVQMELEKVDDYYYKVRIVAPDIEYGVADVSLSYQVEKRDRLRSMLNFSAMVNVQNTYAAETLGYGYPGDWYYLDNNAQETHVGVPIVNGFGELIFKSTPKETTFFTQFDAQLGQVYSEGSVTYGIVQNAVETEQGITLELSNTARNRIITEKAGRITVEDVTVPAEFSLDEETNRILIRIAKENYNDKVKEALVGHGYYPVVEIME